MTRLPIYQVDAFADRLFAGNPAAVVPLTEWLPDETLLAIAAENNLSETAFLLAVEPGIWELRWFTPTSEVPLCGHATLASGFVLAECLGESAETLRFRTRFSGELTVSRKGGLYRMRLPRRRFSPVAGDEAVTRALGVEPVASYLVPVPGDEILMAVLPRWEDVRDLSPDIAAIARLSWRSVLVTAKGGPDCDFVSRYFAPKFGIDEDPVTGSAHCSLAPLWALEYAKSSLVGRQMSARGGTILCEVEDETVVVSGRGALYLEGTIRI